ncbi:nitrate/nitrite transport system permease protein [Herbaspirillum rubrisubalbicans]|uniref:Nitrate ABC transporter, permease protein n=1 Tax=Herbaspirillum rubrisubalbicans TaxID=80842 RepID=A0AAD0UBG6_9BURK|nr:nitrate ABC transporter permease [Herbaspirillum rubrisubalbicans]ALU88231.1 ABC-type nitrate transporter, permease component protein [Herbaspirillum rubrisubalbicans M1]AYR26923.1 nitrate ABC transporter, permease protein [Herbaspirillum rubrisubalbicans]MCP1576529.1 nitrate/nitrite transport system permease protein [Herbaspirillum rubrisubalbicans]
MSAVAESIMGDNAKPAGNSHAGVTAASEPLRAAAANEAQVVPAASAAGSVKPRSLRKKIIAGGLFMRVVPPLLGVALLVLVWQIIALKTASFPTPWVTLKEAGVMFSDPFYRNSPNDQGIGWNVLASLQRVGLGFGLAALVGIPLGFAIGRVEFLARMFGPIISLLRPVSPLAWLPIGLLVFKSANPAAIWSIFICSIWPMIINTAVGVQRVPQDYMNVARVLNLSEWKVLTKILFPSVLPYMLTGVRLSIGTAWLVIVAAEMLTGGVGIGFWVWDEWNNLNVPHIIIAIVVIGVVGLILEQLLVALAKAFTYEQVNH